MNSRRIPLVVFTLVFLICGLAAFYPSHHPVAEPGAFNAGDLAWMLTASAMVLIMTPGLSFFYVGMVKPKTSSLPYSKVL